MKHSRRDLLKLGAVAPALPLSGVLHAQEAFIRPDSPPGSTPNTRFAVNLEMWWTKLPFLERIEQASLLGFPAIEFWPWKGKDIDAIAKACETFSLEVAQFTAWGFTPGLNDPANHDAFVTAIEEGCAVAKRLDAKLMTVVAGNDIAGVSQEEMHAAVIAGLKRAAPIAEAADVTLILEPMNVRVDHKGHCLYGSAPSIAICRAVGSTHVKINWDLYHMQITEGDLCGHLREGIDEIGYVQLADHPGRHEPGTGEINYPRVLFELQELGYRGLVGLECSPRDGELQAATRVAVADAF
jgi:hydroxypyruvate isomerase